MWALIPIFLTFDKSLLMAAVLGNVATGFHPASLMKSFGKIKK
jgi:hypothetical protein